MQEQSVEPWVCLCLSQKAPPSYARSCLEGQACVT